MTVKFIHPIWTNYQSCAHCIAGRHMLKIKVDVATATQYYVSSLRVNIKITKNKSRKEQKNLENQNIFLRNESFLPTDTDECNGTNPCGQSGTCNNTIGLYMCVCDRGYEVKDPAHPYCTGKSLK